MSGLDENSKAKVDGAFAGIDQHIADLFEIDPEEFRSKLMEVRNEEVAVGHALLEMRDKLAEAMSYYLNVNPTLVSDADHESIAVLTQAAEALGV